LFWLKLGYDYFSKQLQFYLEFRVLILVLVEVGLWCILLNSCLKEYEDVLILVLVEVGLWCILLNSCLKEYEDVLIHVLVEVGLWFWCNNTKSRVYKVLILVLVEVGLWCGVRAVVWEYKRGGLNPCFGGSWVMIQEYKGMVVCWVRVLILVLVEVGLWSSSATWWPMKISLLS